MALELNGTTGVSLVQDGVVTAADLSSTLDLTGKTVTLPAGVSGVVASGFTGGDGGYSSSEDVIAALAIDLSQYAGKTLIATGRTSIAEQANTANSCFIGIYRYNDASTVLLGAQKYGMGAYGVWQGNSTTPASVTVFHTIPSGLSSTSGIRLSAGINAGGFYYGAQANYALYTGNYAGFSLSYIII